MIGHRNERAWVHGNIRAWVHGNDRAWVHGNDRAWVHGNVRAWVPSGSMRPAVRMAAVPWDVGTLEASACAPPVLRMRGAPDLPFLSGPPLTRAALPALFLTSGTCNANLNGPP